MKNSFLILFLFLSLMVRSQVTYDNMENLRSDSIDVLHYHLDLDMTQTENQFISGAATVKFSSLEDGLQHLPLDLLALTVDSVKQENQQLNFSYNDTLLTINLGRVVDSSDVDSVVVHYSGSPTQDATWGGFFFSGNYAYNMGVGFDAKPHNYGRIWHPCFDNFKERATYSFNVKTDDNQVSTCNGLLVNETQNGQVTTRQWELNNAIPSYLACIAVAPYATVHQNHRNIPIELYSLPSDTNNLKASFSTLPDAMDAYIDNYGPYRFSKVGYSIVPFNAGAMEHATNIAYPRYAIDGTLGNETLMAHELSHHWWGDLATCETPEEMWLNEGMASFSEYLYLEHVYGYDRAKQAIKQTLETVVKRAHIDEDEFRPVSGVPHQYTYGRHVYDKGSLVAHNLRFYLGDSTFFNGVESFLDQYRFKTMNSEQLRDHLNTQSTTDISPFFENWVFGAGFPTIEIEEFSASQSGNDYSIELTTEQKLFGADEYYTNVPVNITFYGQNREKHTVRIVHDSQFATHYINNVPFDPEFVTVNEDIKLAQAVLDDFYKIDSPGQLTADYSSFDLEVEQISDSALLRVEHYYSAPDEVDKSIQPYKVSNTHYWRVDGIIPNDFHASGSLQYSASGTNSFLDTGLVSITEDSLILLYREIGSNEWSEYPHYTKNVLGNSNNGFGLIQLDTVLLGEYAFANLDHSVLGKNELKKSSEKDYKLYPNPTKDFVNVSCNECNGSMLSLFNVKGQLIKEEKLTQDLTRIQLPDSTGKFIYIIKDNDKILERGTLISQ
ncbi:M1 family aminopeptidase [Salibacter sp.]|uniref:M1 family aminopeptidase n=1 Tax=Salibacter sp. TaxID=2010995 RepID=UPI00287003C9|nr:M1 family aminopeptidase [Salibacter sp.]MDR9488517.1 M1 family aminopeptidase [Salibacter sp.]